MTLLRGLGAGSLTVSSTNVFGFLEVGVWASGKNGPSNPAARRTLRLRSSQKATEAISRRSRGCSVWLKSSEQISASAEHGNVGLQPHTLCRDQRHQQGFGQSHRWIKTGTFPLTKIFKKHPGVKWCPAEQATRRPQGDVKASSAVVEELCQSCWSKNSRWSQSQTWGSGSSWCCRKGQMGFNEQNHTMVNRTYKSASVSRISSGYFRDE